MERLLDSLRCFRLFSDELSKLRKAVIHARDADGFRKYENESHFIRCAVVRLIRSESEALEIKKGRPKKYENGREKG